MVRGFHIGLAAVTGVLMVGGAARPGDRAFTVERGVRQLFLDDVGIAKVEGLERVVHQLRRHAMNPLSVPDTKWEGVCAVHLNADARAGGIEVGLHDAAGKAIPGFERSRSINGDVLQAAVDWGRPVPASLRGRRVRLRIELKRAELYSYGWE